MVLNKMEDNFDAIYEALYPANIKELIDDNSILPASEQCSIISRAIATVVWSIIDDNSFTTEDPFDITYYPHADSIEDLMQYPPFLSAVSQEIIKKQNISPEVETDVIDLFSLSYVNTVASNLWRSVATSLVAKTFAQAHDKAIDIIEGT